MRCTSVDSVGAQTLQFDAFVFTKLVLLHATKSCNSENTSACLITVDWVVKIKSDATLFQTDPLLSTPFKNTVHTTVSQTLNNRAIKELYLLQISDSWAFKTLLNISCSLQCMQSWPQRVQNIVHMDIVPITDDLWPAVGEGLVESSGRVP